MPAFLNSLPLWAALALLIVFLTGISQLLLLWVRRTVPVSMMFGHEESHFGAAVIHSMMVFYGLVAALLAVNVYEMYTEVSHTVSREAAAISAVYRDAGGYPEPIKGEVRQAIRDYTQQIIHEAWPQQRKGIIPTGGVALVTRVHDLLDSFEPATEGQKIVHVETLEAMNELLIARRLRVDANREGLPGVMWGVLLFGAVLCLFSACFFRVPNAKLHAFGLALLASLIAVVLFMILAWDRPFVGEFGVDPDSYELVYEQLMKG
jgi:hypothetical protein